MNRIEKQLPLVSIITVNFNGKDFLGILYDSLRQQTYEPVEYILVDNASSDGSVQFVKENFPEVTFVEDKCLRYSQNKMVLIKSGFVSFCEHHFVPMVGKAYVAYLPNKKLIGLSKIPRIVRYFSRRPQIQERLTAQIADSLSLLLDTEDVAVVTQATHYCVLARGVEDEQNHTTTQVLKGCFSSEEMWQRNLFDQIK